MTTSLCLVIRVIFSASKTWGKLDGNQAGGLSTHSAPFLLSERLVSFLNCVKILVVFPQASEALSFSHFNIIFLMAIPIVYICILVLDCFIIIIIIIHFLVSCPARWMKSKWMDGCAAVTKNTSDSSNYQGEGIVQLFHPSLFNNFPPVSQKWKENNDIFHREGIVIWTIYKITWMVQCHFLIED